MKIDFSLKFDIIDEKFVLFYYTYNSIIPFALLFAPSFCAQAYNLKLKLSLINLSNEQNKYLTIRNFIHGMYFTMKRIMLYTIYKSSCVCAKQINEGECCGSNAPI